MSIETNVTPTPVCSHTSTVPTTKPVYRKERSKFGFLWLIFTIITCGFGLLLWLVWPRHKVLIGDTVTGYVCTNCRIEL